MSFIIFRLLVIIMRIIIMLAAVVFQTLKLTRKTPLYICFALMLGHGLSACQPDDVKIYAQPGIAFEAASPEQQDSLRKFETLKTEASQNPKDWRDIAMALRLQREFLAASFAYTQAAELVSDKAEKALLFGASGEVLVEADGKIISAAAALMFEEALSYDPAALGARYYLGVYHEANGNTARALEHYREFIRYSNREHPFFRAVNTKILELSGSTNGGESRKIAPILEPEVIDKFNALEEDKQAAFLLSMMKRRYDTLLIDGASADEWRDIARMLQRLGDRNQALKAYDQALLQMPENAALILERAQLTK